MSFLGQWWRQPQKVWLRRALFQVHLWTGVGTGIYILLISISGSVLVFRIELHKKFARGPVSSGRFRTIRSTRYGKIRIQTRL